jgi:hypothetical protein
MEYVWRESYVPLGALGEYIIVYQPAVGVF